MDEDSKKYKDEDIQDAMWKNAECKSIYEGQINFRKNKKQELLKKVSKGICFMIIAAISGGVTAGYVINKSLSLDIENKLNVKGENLKFRFNLGSNNGNLITKVAELVCPAVVGINRQSYDVSGDLEGSGTGVIFRKDGYIVTNKHIIGNSKNVKVKLNNDKELDAKVIGADTRYDLAVIKVDAQNLPTVKFGDSSKIKVGELAIAIGNPQGEQYSSSVTAGIISALNKRTTMLDRNTGEKSVYKVIQTDATIGKGNSGGALCNINGEVIGINTFKMNLKSCLNGIGFAIGINEVQSIVNSIMEYGKVSRPALGISGGMAIPQAKDAVKGVYVQEVTKESGASKAGIRPTDIIVKIDNINVKTMDDISITLEKYKVGETITCKIWRRGKFQDIKLILSEYKNK